jgi:hypothetical protein
VKWLCQTYVSPEFRAAVVNITTLAPQDLHAYACHAAWLEDHRNMDSS